MLLRTIGTLHYSDIPTVQAYMESIQESDLPKFATQLFALLEDIRLEEIVKKPVREQWPCSKTEKLFKELL